MGGEKHGSKSGRYVGGFLQLFDWNAKSRKKLFPSKFDLPDSKYGKRGEESFPMTRIRVEADEEEFGAFGAGLSVRGGSDYSCASSVTDDDGYGIKAPGVVARLMGLDSLPTSNAGDPYSSPFFDSISLREAPFRGRNLDFYHDHQIMQSSQLCDRRGATSRNNELETRSMKLTNRPIEKFQTEILPPKSAKTIPLTHHKLLSPIKSPIFVPSQDAAHIMEAAAKIIEPGPPANPRAKLSTGGSSSVPFKVREMREKLEAAAAAQRPSTASEQRPVESKAAKCLKGQPMNKSWNGSAETLSREPPSREESSVAIKNKGKSISLAIQAKVNVQKREALTSSSKSLGEPENQDNNKSTQISRNQAGGPKSNRKSLNHSTSSVLRQNNQKQNCPSHRERSAPKASVTTTSSKKAFSEETSHGRQKSSTREGGTSRTSSRKSSLHARENGKGVPYAGVRNVPRKKRSIDGNMHFDKNQVTENMMLSSKHEKPSESSVVADKQFSWIEESRRKGMDVVSFTFTAPITRSQLGSEPSRELAENDSSVFSDDGSKMSSGSELTRLSSPGLTGIKGDALSKLLEQLTSNLEKSHSTIFKTGTALESAQQTVVPRSAESATGKVREKTFQQEPLVFDTNSQLFSDLFTNEAELFKRKFNFQAGEEMEKYSCDKTETKKWNNIHLPSPISILEPSFLTESCCSSETSTSCVTEEIRQCSSIEAQEVIGSRSSQISTAIEAESESASSTFSSQINAEKYSMKSTAWELGYVKDILSNAELMFKDYVAGRTREIVNPHLFDQIERRRGGGKDEFKQERKMLFDCVGECLDLKCQRFVGGGFEMWTKGIATLKRKERVAEEVYKEIQVWRNLGNSMVDELVDKDMSSKYGRWLDFEVDEFMLGVEIEGQIVDSLVGEIVSDILSSDLSSH
ncbi:hypothetical protein BVRB_3g048000 isoform A [Beta vulgaris subsp. vulgaris]|uniref:uncharacterized protein LOC104887848 isoform X2 n=1 Tax=Beta vulgaris subsp. vulgaris TaxID=3555 RepID=UPI00053FB852|nr:uncharacterized protein LOC104887848 isoform X2 [Beta vulgaris subsp. vulgaris]KMT16501.1 hypothetical protein BVRB_3g048000 isoform A [Beta vulgaris subsp. vulgaris]